MSKSAKKVIVSAKNGGVCKYIMIRGKKKGKKCGAPSRGDFCKEHNKTRKKYEKQYNNTKKIERKEQRIKKKLKEYELEVNEKNIPSKDKLDCMYADLHQKKIALQRKLSGYDIYKGLDADIAQEKILSAIWRKCEHLKKGGKPIECTQYNDSMCHRCVLENRIEMFGLNDISTCTYRPITFACNNKQDEEDQLTTLLAKKDKLQMKIRYFNKLKELVKKKNKESE